MLKKEKMKIRKNTEKDYLENEFRLLFEKTAKMENELNKETNHLMKVLA